MEGHIETAQPRRRRAARAVQRIRRPAFAALAAAIIMLFATVMIAVRHVAVVIGEGPTIPNSQALPINNDLSKASSVLWLNDESVVSYELKPKTVALTFDDGPSREWTPLIQAVLDQHGVPGTFFVIGQQVTRNPDVVQSLVAAGHEIGNHSYTHAELGTLSAWQVRLQTQLTDRAIIAATGRRPVVFRPPYSGQPAYLPPAELRAARTALAAGPQLLVLTDLYPRDFAEGVSVDELLVAATPQNGESAVITLHDAGGDRARTVEVLQRLIPHLQAEGYRFVTASEMSKAPLPLRASVDASDIQAAAAQHEAGTIVSSFLRLLQFAAVFAAGISVVRAIALFVAARRHTRREDTHADYDEPVSVVIPAYNEAVGIEAAVRSIATCDYPAVRVVVVDDGSADRTAEIVENIDLDNVVLVRQTNGGKSSALNTGVAACDTDVIIMVDGDTVFEPDTVREIVRPFADPEVGAVAGNAKVGNRRNLVTVIQHVEYAQASELERRLFVQLGVSACVPGAIGAFRRTALHDVGGLSTDTLAEDSDLTVAIARAGWRIDFAPRARAWTEAPSTFRGLLKQRRRWSYGVLQVIAKHRHALVERGRGGRLARIMFPYQLLTTYTLPVVAPAIDLMLLYETVFSPSSRLTVLSLWLAVNTMTAASNMYALRLGGERLRSGWWVAFGQQLVYRQVLYIAVLRSVAAAISGVRLAWQTPPREGGLVAPSNAPCVVAPTVAVTNHRDTLVA